MAAKTVAPAFICISSAALRTISATSWLLPEQRTMPTRLSALKVRFTLHSRRLRALMASGVFLEEDDVARGELEEC